MIHPEINLHIQPGDFVSKESQPGVFGRIDWRTEELCHVCWNSGECEICRLSELMKVVAGRDDSRKAAAR